MKKILFFAVAAFAFTLTSCNQKTETPNGEVTEDTTQLVLDEVQAATDSLTAALEGNDVAGFQKVYETVMEKIKTMDPAIVKEYLPQVQQFIKDNMDKVKALVGTNQALASSIDAFAAMPADQLDNVTETITNVQNQLKGTGDATVKDIQDKLKETGDDAKAKAAEAVNNATEKATEKANKAIDDATKKVADGVKGKLGL